jgi:hypothetical protein
MLLVRICAGGDGKPSSLPRLKQRKLENLIRASMQSISCGLDYVNSLL